MSIKKKINDYIDGLDKNNKTIDKIKKAPDKLVNWAENNRKKLFVITISFLVLTFLSTVIFTISRFKKSKAVKEEIMIMRDSLREQRKAKESNSIPEQIINYQTLKKYEDEINELMKKDSLTSEDSLRIVELYDILIYNELNKNMNYE